MQIVGSWTRRPGWHPRGGLEDVLRDKGMEKVRCIEQQITVRLSFDHLLTDVVVQEEPARYTVDGQHR